MIGFNMNSSDDLKKKNCRRKMPPKDTDEYREKRDRNNEAVKKSRELTKQKTNESFSRVIDLKRNNEKLEGELDILSTELSYLKDLFKIIHKKKRSNDDQSISIPKIRESIKNQNSDNNCRIDDHSYDKNNKNEQFPIKTEDVCVKSIDTNIVEYDLDCEFSIPVSHEELIETSYQCCTPIIEEEIEIITCDDSSEETFFDNLFTVNLDALMNDHTYSLSTRLHMSDINGFQKGDVSCV